MCHTILNNQHKYDIDSEGILQKIDEINDDGEVIRPAVLPRSLWTETIKQYHDSKQGGHRKYKKVISEMKQNYYFLGMTKYVKYYIQTCLECQLATKTKETRNPMHHAQMSYPGILIHLDHMKGTKETERGNKYILAIINNFSGYTKLYEVSQPDAKTTASKVMDYINVNSMPLRIISDNGTEFSNELMQELGLLLGLKQTFITAYNSKSNGKVENLHKTVQRMIRSFIENFKTSWNLLLPYLEFTINTSKSEVTAYTPFFIHFGRHPNYPVDTFYGTTY